MELELYRNAVAFFSLFFFFCGASDVNVLFVRGQGSCMGHDVVVIKILRIVSHARKTNRRP